MAKYFDNKGKRTSLWKFGKESGLFEKMKTSGIVINPTHDFELLKRTRLEIYKIEKSEFIDERKVDDVATSDNDLKMLYQLFLEEELKIIEQWLSDKHPNGNKKSMLPTSTFRVEILKYKDFVLGEIKTLTKSEVEQNNTEVKKPTEKFYALYHWVLIEMGKETPFNKDDFDRYSAKEIKNYAKNKYQLTTTGTEFYTWFTAKIDITNKTEIAKNFKKGYRDILIQISDNNADVISYVLKFPHK